MPTVTNAGNGHATSQSSMATRYLFPVPRLLCPQVWRWGWTRSAETWNGRIAMIAILAILAVEVSTGQGILSALWALPDTAHSAGL